MNHLETKTAGISINKLLEKNNRKGMFFIKNTRISVNFIARCWRSGLGAEEIIAEYPHIPPAGVYAALAYYFANRETLDTEIKVEIEEEKRLGFEHNQRQAQTRKELI